LSPPLQFSLYKPISLFPSLQPIKLSKNPSSSPYPTPLIDHPNFSKEKLSARFIYSLYTTTMSGVWVYKNGVFRLVENPEPQPQEGGSTQAARRRRKELVYLPTGEVITSYQTLERILKGLGWEVYYGGVPDLYQFHKQSSIDLISLPRDFSKFNSVYMYDIVVKNPNIFHVRDA